MAALSRQPSLGTPNSHAAKPAASVKALIESSGFVSVPSNYSYSTQVNDSCAGSDPDESLPVIDFSVLTSHHDAHQRSKAIQDLEKACRDWGFFMLVNHGIPESTMKTVLDTCNEFFNLPLEEKLQFAGRDVWNPIRAGTGVDIKVQNVSLWRDFLKLFVHPQFHSPSKPQGVSEAVREYSKRIREVMIELLKGVSETLGLEESYIEKEMDLESGFQLFAANLYPLCPNPELAIGIPAHADHGLLTLLIQNGIGGLQIQHNGKWFNVDPLPNSILVNTADQLEILSNGKYKSVMHRAVVNDKATRISVATAHGPRLDKVVVPAPELVEREGCAPAFKPMTYKEYIELQQKNPIGGANPLDKLRL